MDNCNVLDFLINDALLSPLFDNIADVLVYPSGDSEKSCIEQKSFDVFVAVFGGGGPKRTFVSTTWPTYLVMPG